MKILIITQKVDINDSVLGFFHGWIAEFAKHCEKLTVICLYEGEHGLPNNVKVLSLGKENYSTLTATSSDISTAPSVIPAQAGIQELAKQNMDSRMCKNDKSPSVFKKAIYIFRFYGYIIKERKNYDTVFVHMNQVYVILGWPLWKIWKKKTGLWYTHKAVSTSLRIAEKLADVIFTASKLSFRIPSKKVKVIGHGIDIQKFKDSKRPRVSSRPEVSPQDPERSYRIITIGRISPVKDYGTLIDAVEILHKKGKNIRVEIIGGPGTPEQEKYFKGLKTIVAGKGLDNEVKFTGPIPNKDIPSELQKADLFINMSLTGSLDKAVLEAMASEIPILTCNEAIINDVLSEYRDRLFFEKGDADMLSDKIIKIMEMNIDEKHRLGKELSGIVEKDHNLNNLIGNIVSTLAVH
jgi:glycosyltransferase involved in cell wall biosynthesis